MSQWTHVAGILRVDVAPPLLSDGDDVISAIEKVMGKIVRWDDEVYETTLPLGSEGSLRYLVQDVVPVGENDISRIIISIWGDLRDYDSIEEITSWWKRIGKEIDNTPGVWGIRQGAIQIQVEGGDIVLLPSFDSAAQED